MKNCGLPNEIGNIAATTDLTIGMTILCYVFVLARCHFAVHFFGKSPYSVDGLLTYFRSLILTFQDCRCVGFQLFSAISQAPLIVVFLLWPAF